MSGKIIDGWEFIWAAFSITWIALAAYSVTLVWRERRSRSSDSGSDA